MTSFRMQERDLDLFILEELHSDSGFAEWLAARLGLAGHAFTGGQHSASAKLDARWGETDVLAFFSDGAKRVAVLIEDKIAAGFQDRQAERYHERARVIIQDGKADEYRTLLVAPQSYLAGVPADDPWDHRIAIETIRDWFAGCAGAHADWRRQALTACLTTSRPPIAGREDVVRFSSELSAYLALFHAPALVHAPGRDPQGPVIRGQGYKPSQALLWWKMRQNQMTLQLSPPFTGRIASLVLPPDITADFRPVCDFLVVEVPGVDVSLPLEDQKDAVDAAISAAYRLMALMPQIEAAPPAPPTIRAATHNGPLAPS